MKKKIINKHTLEIDKSYIGLYHFGISTLGLLYVVLIAIMIMSLFGCAGNDGANGVNGYNSIMKQVPSIACNNGGVSVLSGIDISRDGILQGDEVMSISDVCNGEDYNSYGEISIVGIIDPCGDSPNVNDEILLKLSNGALLASFSDDASGKNTHFAYLTPGNYETTDGTHCHFTVTDYGTTTNERIFEYNK